MRLSGHRGTRVHAPDNTLTALLSAYTGGADGLEFDLQLTRDGELVLSHDPTTDRMTGRSGRIIDLTLAELRALDFSETFRPLGAPHFRYYNSERRRMLVSTLDELLERLPVRVPKLIALKHESTLGTGRRDEAVGHLVGLLRDHDQLDVAVVYSMDPDALRLLRSTEGRLAIAAFDERLEPAAQLALMRDLGADGLVTQLSHVLDPQQRLTEIGRELKREFEQEKLRVGAVLHPHRADRPWSITAEQYTALSPEPFVWSVAVDSILHAAEMAGACRPWLAESFSGKEIDTHRFALGYAKANPYCHVFQNDGIHIKIRPYDGHPVPWPPDSIERDRLSDLEEAMTYVAKDWPYYSGGGVGVVRAIRGDFCAEVDYEVTDAMAQATTLEMAVVNVDPGAHWPPWNPNGTPRLPSSFRDKDSFYDPHGAPPYVGVEHDEDDGYRINWNLGYEYDNNQYGQPVGDGRTPKSGRLRLERRGAYFSAYYRNKVDAPEWVCVGTVCNESLNLAVYLRCAAKRWRQERPGTVGEYVPVRSNEFIFRNLTITHCVKEPSS